jgi:hypothetical protein
MYEYAQMDRSSLLVAFEEEQLSVQSGTQSIKELSTTSHLSMVSLFRELVRFATYSLGPGLRSESRKYCTRLAICLRNFPSL